MNFRYQIITKKNLEDNYKEILILKNKRICLLFSTKIVIYNQNTFMPLVTISENNEEILKISDFLFNNDFFILALIKEEIFVYNIKKSYKLVKKIEAQEDSCFIGLSDGKILLVDYTWFKIYSYEKQTNEITFDILFDTYDINYSLEDKANLNFTNEAINDYWQCMNVKNLYDALDMSTFKWDDYIITIKNVIEINDNNLLFFAEKEFIIKSKPLEDGRYAGDFWNSIYDGKSMLIIINDKEGNEIKTFTITSFIYSEDLYGDGNIFNSIDDNQFELRFEWDEIKYSFYKEIFCLLIKKYFIFFDLKLYKTKVFYTDLLSINLYKNNLLYFDYGDECWNLKKCELKYDSIINNSNLSLDKNKFSFTYLDILKLYNPYYFDSKNNPKIIFYNSKSILYIHSAKKDIKQIVKINLFI